MSLRDVCRTVAMHGLPSAPVSQVCALAVTAEKLAASAMPGKQIAPADLDEVCRRVHDLLARGEDLSIRDLRLAPWCLWSTDTPLVRDTGRVEILLRQIAERGQRRALRTLAAVWLKFFSPGGPLMARVGDFLAKHVEKLGPPWTQAHQALSLFSATLGPMQLALAAIKRDGTPDDVLASFNFRDPSSWINYRNEAFRLGFEQFERTPGPDPMKRLAALRRWTLENGKLRADALKGPAVKAALHPFEGKPPEKEIRDAYLDFILPWMKDPRVNSASWANCEKAEAVLRRWLTEQSLRQFLEVVDRVANPEHWVHRKAFWNALYSKGYVDDAWVVFETSGAKMANALFGREISFSRFSGGSIQEGHSALLLRIGSLIVAEWSHSSPCSIWDESANERGPSFYCPSYAATELKKAYNGDRTAENMGSQGVFWHYSSESYGWQRRIAAYLKQKRGIRLTDSDFTVQR